METKPVYCSECGAVLTGSATFCSACGARQETDSVPVVESAPAVNAVPTVVAAPDNSLAAPKAKLSKIGLILAVMALCTTFLAIILTVVRYFVIYGVYFDEMVVALSQNQGAGMLLAWVAPLVALVLVLAKNKKLARIGLILAGVSLVMQFLFAIMYILLMRASVSTTILSTLMRPVNGEALFSYIGQLFRFGSNPPSVNARLLLNLFESLFYFAKNILSALACLMVITKKAK